MSPSKVRKSPLVRVDHRARWTSWLDPSTLQADASQPSLGRPGLWRSMPQSEGRLVAAFDCPAPALLEPTASEAPEALARFEAELNDWMITTANGAAPGAWRGPRRVEVESWFDQRLLSVRTGGHVARGRLDCEENRLRIRFPDFVRLDERLPAARLDWLQAFCLDAQSRWQLVRFGLLPQRVCAEVDLTGAPLELLPALTVWAIEALRVAVEWALPGCSLIADPDLSCALLDQTPSWSGDRLPSTSETQAGV